MDRKDYGGLTKNEIRKRIEHWLKLALKSSDGEDRVRAATLKEVLKLFNINEY